MDVKVFEIAYGEDYVAALSEDQAREFLREDYGDEADAWDIRALADSELDEHQVTFDSDDDDVPDDKSFRSVLEWDIQRGKEPPFLLATANA